MKPKISRDYPHVYVIDDGESHWYVAASARSAMAQYRTDNGISAADMRLFSHDVKAERCDDAEELTITSRASDTGESEDEHRTQTCREWAEEAESGLIATTDDS